MTAIAYPPPPAPVSFPDNLNQITISYKKYKYQSVLSYPYLLRIRLIFSRFGCDTPKAHKRLWFIWIKVCHSSKLLPNAALSPAALSTFSITSEALTVKSSIAFRMCSTKWGKSSFSLATPATIFLVWRGTLVFMSRIFKGVLIVRWSVEWFLRYFTKLPKVHTVLSRPTTQFVSCLGIGYFSMLAWRCSMEQHFALKSPVGNSIKFTRSERTNISVALLPAKWLETIFGHIFQPNCLALEVADEKSCNFNQLRR